LKKIFDKKSKRNKKLKPIKSKIQYRSTYNDLYNLPEDKLEWYIENGFPEERDMARGIRTERKRMRLATYGY
jgi:hypothetical protein